MDEHIKRFSLLCPFCKEVISFELKEEDLQRRFEGGLACIRVAEHGNPLHALEVYVDKSGQIRGAYLQKKDKVKGKTNKKKK
ncbi:MAG: hypothetical protein ACFFDW_01370 [Candidatus Thorarchaeota archaeon]